MPDAGDIRIGVLLLSRHLADHLQLGREGDGHVLARELDLGNGLVVPAGEDVDLEVLPLVGWMSIL